MKLTTKTKVTFNYNYSGAPSVVTQEVESGQKVKASIIAPPRLGYTFRGWKSVADGTGNYFDFDTITITVNLTLYLPSWVKSLR